jgi:hypothetical protein
MRLAVSSALLLSLFVAACSSSSGGSSTPCNQDPWECSSGQTCWPQSQTAYACMNAGPGMLGTSCMNTPGTPTCGPGLFCFQTSQAGGTCLAYCSPTDPKHACTGSALCQGVFLVAGGPQVNVCVPMATGGDGGTGPDGSGTADGGSDAPAGG